MFQSVLPKQGAFFMIRKSIFNFEVFANSVLYKDMLYARE